MLFIAFKTESVFTYEKSRFGAPSIFGAFKTEIWSEAIAVGNFNFVEKVKSELGSKAAHREVTHLENVRAVLPISPALKRPGPSRRVRRQGA